VFPPEAQDAILALTLRLSRARAVLSTIRLTLPGADEPRQERIERTGRVEDLASVAMDLVAGAEEELETLDRMQVRRPM
jgi:hypothetical protein